MSKRALIVAFLALTGLLSGCNTVRGMGQDIEKAGEAISGAANK